MPPFLFILNQFVPVQKLSREKKFTLDAVSYNGPDF